MFDNEKPFGCRDLPEISEYQLSEEEIAEEKVLNDKVAKIRAIYNELMMRGVMEKYLLSFDDKEYEKDEAEKLAEERFGSWFKDLLKKKFAEKDFKLEGPRIKDPMSVLQKMFKMKEKGWTTVLDVTDLIGTTILTDTVDEMNEVYAEKMEEQYKGRLSQHLSYKKFSRAILEKQINKNPEAYLDLLYKVFHNLRMTFEECDGFRYVRRKNKCTVCSQGEVTNLCMSKVNTNSYEYFLMNIYKLINKNTERKRQLDLLKNGEDEWESTEIDYTKEDRKKFLKLMGKITMMVF